MSLLTEHVTPDCTCQDPDVDLLRVLVSHGHDQGEASKLLWGRGAPISSDLAIAYAGRLARQVVRDQLKGRLPWLRLPRDRDAH